MTQWVICGPVKRKRPDESRRIPRVVYAHITRRAQGCKPQARNEEEAASTANPGNADPLRPGTLRGEGFRSLRALSTPRRSPSIQADPPRRKGENYG